MIEFLPVKAVCQPLGLCKVRAAVKHTPKLHPSSLLCPTSIAVRASTFHAMPCAPGMGEKWAVSAVRSPLGLPRLAQGDHDAGYAWWQLHYLQGGKIYWLHGNPLSVYYCSSYKKKLEFQCVALQIRGLVRTQPRVSNSAFQCLIPDRHFSCN